VPVEPDGRYERSDHIAEISTFPDLYREIFGHMPAGAAWDALNWLTHQTGEMTYVGLAPRGTPAVFVAALRQGFERASRDPDFIRETMARNGVPFSFIGVARGEATFRALADVSPEVLRTLRVSIAPNR
jgi:hypothetical protein